MKRNPLRAMVRIHRCWPPSSPIARRAALMRASMAESETTRPLHTAARRSSLLTTRWRFRDQKFEKVKHLRLDWKRGRSRAQLAPHTIECHVAKKERHGPGSGKSES